MNKRNYFTGKQFTVNRAKRKLGKARTHAELIARMRQPLVISKTERVKAKCEYLDFKNDRCKNDALVIVNRNSKAVKLCRLHCKDVDKIMGRINAWGGVRVADSLPNNSPKTVKTDISKVVEDRSDYFLSESELESIKASIIKSEESK